MIVNIPHAYNKDFKVIGSPMKLSGTPVEYHHAPPSLGEHTLFILSQFKTQKELLQLEEQGIIECPNTQHLQVTG